MLINVNISAYALACIWKRKNMSEYRYSFVTKDGYVSFPDKYMSLREAAQYLGIGHKKLESLIQSDLLVWKQAHRSVTRGVESKSLVMMKYPADAPSFEPIFASDGRKLKKVIDQARISVAKAAGISPGEVSISFEIDSKTLQEI